MTAGRTITTAALLAALALSTACGRKSGLDTPYEAALDARKQAERAKVEPLPPVPEPPVKDKPFVLDWLLD